MTSGGSFLLSLTSSDSRRLCGVGATQGTSKLSQQSSIVDYIVLVNCATGVTAKNVFINVFFVANFDVASLTLPDSPETIVYLPNLAGDLSQWVVSTP